MSADAIYIEGIEKFQKLMKEFPEEFNRKVLTAVARRAAVPLIEEARGRAPVSKISRVEWWGKRKRITPGQMRKSIGSRKTSFSEPAGVKVGPSRRNGWWAHFVEFGTAGYSVKKGKNKGRFIPGQRPQPFMRPAFNDTKDAIIKIYADDFREVLYKYIRKNK
jgi:HK97 gp10 family phage protein